MTRFLQFSPLSSHLMGWSLLALACAFFLLFPAEMPSSNATKALIALGAVAMWRYSWATLHFCRALLYRAVKFPCIRANANAPKADHLYVVVLSFRFDSDVNALVYGALFRDLESYGCPATVVACTSDAGDEAVLRSLAPSPRIRIVGLQQNRRGKRDAMERALELLANDSPIRSSLVALVDGDTLIPRGTFEKAGAIVLSNPTVGAVTSDSVPLVDGSAFAREWYRLRMRQRHELMCSISLSEKVLVLTGRFSLFRSDVALARGFVAAVGRDATYHWRLGRIPMLTGDDKSTWFWTLRNGWNMLYVPDVTVYCLEKLPQAGFVKSTSSLMFRYFGNMARNNGRAINLGPSRVRLFVWLSLIDQRLSPWTSLFGPLTILGHCVATRSLALLPAYGLWVLTTRLAQTIILGWFGRAFHPFFPFLQFYNQVIGAFLKISVFFQPNLQRWTRQSTGAGSADASASSAMLMWLALTFFGLSVAMFANL